MSACLLRIRFVVLLLWLSANVAPAALPDSGSAPFPRPLTSYPPAPGASLLQVLTQRVHDEPFNLVATVIFFLAIVHTFLAPRFTRAAHEFKRKHRQRLESQGKLAADDGAREEVSFAAEALHFLGEIEAVFGIWVIPLLIAMTLDRGWPTARDYIGKGLDFTEPLFVVVIMTIAASRPVLKACEQLLSFAAALGKGSPTSWWLVILTLGPLLGSVITEPAAMTISALLLADKFYSRNPSAKLAYATLGLLFVNVSVGGTLTEFAAPPVLMVANKWNWGPAFMFLHFGWKAVVGIVLANLAYFGAFLPELHALNQGEPDGGRPPAEGAGAAAPPLWVTLVHIFFLVWTVLTSHYPALFIGGFLFYLAFMQTTEHHQNDLALRPALLVGFFLAGLVVHGGLQGWWIAPILSGLRQTPLFVVAAILTAFNDNAAITYLASLVPNLSESLKYAVVAGAVTGGGLTVIANAPNPAGQAILGKFFPNGISPLGLLLGALIPTILVGVLFLIL